MTFSSRAPPTYATPLTQPPQFRVILDPNLEIWSKFSDYAVLHLFGNYLTLLYDKSFLMLLQKLPH